MAGCADHDDPHFAVEDLIAEGDKVLLRWSFTGKHIGSIMGLNQSKQISVGGMNFQLVKARSSSSGSTPTTWASQQLGAVPTT